MVLIVLSKRLQNEIFKLEQLMYARGYQWNTAYIEAKKTNLIHEEIGDIIFDFTNAITERNIYKAYERKQHFGMIENAFIRLVDARNNKEMCKYNLTENYSGMTAMIFGEIYRHNGEWKFNAMGNGTTDPGIGELCRRFS